MKLRAVLPSGMVLVALALLGWASPAQADDANATVKIAVCDPIKVFQTMQEAKDFNAKWKSDADDLSKQSDIKKADLQSKKAQLDALKPSSPEYAKQMDDLLSLEADDQAWVQAQQAILNRHIRLKQEQLFQKVVAAVGEVAKAKGVSLVINSAHPEFPDLDHLDNNAFFQVVLMHVSLYADTSKLDITEDVITNLDKAYAAANH